MVRAQIGKRVLGTKSADGVTDPEVCVKHDHKSMFKALFERNGNQSCADCRSFGPEYLAPSLGILLCKRCATTHRLVGTGGPQYLFALMKEELEFMSFLTVLSNAEVGEIWGDCSPDQNPTVKDMCTFVDMRYIKKRFIKSWCAKERRGSRQVFLPKQLDASSPQELKDLLLLEAIEWGSLIDVLHALALGANARSQKVDGADKSVALHEAAKRGHFHICFLLIHNGAEVFVRDDKRRTAAHVALESGHRGLAESLREYERSTCLRLLHYITKHKRVHGKRYYLATKRTKEQIVMAARKMRAIPVDRFSRLIEDLNREIDRQDFNEVCGAGFDSSENLDIAVVRVLRLDKERREFHYRLASMPQPVLCQLIEDVLSEARRRHETDVNHIRMGLGVTIDVNEFIVDVKANGGNTIRKKATMRKANALSREELNGILNSDNSIPRRSISISAEGLHTLGKTKNGDESENSDHQSVERAIDRLLSMDKQKECSRCRDLEARVIELQSELQKEKEEHEKQMAAQVERGNRLARMVNNLSGSYDTDKHRWERKIADLTNVIEELRADRGEMLQTPNGSNQNIVVPDGSAASLNMKFHELATVPESTASHEAAKSSESVTSQDPGSKESINQSRTDRGAHLRATSADYVRRIDVEIWHNKSETHVRSITDAVQDLLKCAEARDLPGIVSGTKKVNDSLLLFVGHLRRAPPNTLNISTSKFDALDAARAKLLISVDMTKSEPTLLPRVNLAILGLARIVREIAYVVCT
eukprot:Clim_evm5s221 gene=Clim_evmTU5s221